MRKAGSVVDVVPQPSGYNERIRAERARGGYAEQLERTRESAKGWQTGQVAVLGLVSVVGTVKTQQSLDALTGVARWIAAVAMVLALVAAVTGVVMLGLAGRPLPTPRRRAEAPAAADAERAIRRAARQIRASLIATVTAVGLLAVAVVSTWLPMSSAAPAGLVRIVTPVNTLCGKLSAGQGSMVVIDVGGQPITVPGREVISLVPVKRCG